MATVALEGMKFYAYHGFYEEERKIGAWYIVDIYIETNFAVAAKDDNLGGTINYETVFRVTKMEMLKSSQLIETVGQRIINQLKTLFAAMETIRLRLTKLNPPLGEEVAKAYIEISESYRVECAKCKRILLAQIPFDCWTKYGQVYPETRETLIRTFAPSPAIKNINLCQTCIQPYLIRPRES